MACVTVIIPHCNGREVLRRCLHSLRSTRFRDYRVLVVDNASIDGSADMVREAFPETGILTSSRNLGFAGGCNLGIRGSDSPYIVLLNNDAEVTPDWLGILVRAADEDSSVAAVQPKIRSLFDRSRFDYSGAAGGELDIFGYPFAMGRLFEHMERDDGQYDRTRSVFWATGAATLLRRSALGRVGLLDERFFAHMEEIDLNWRMHTAGYTVRYIPEALVYHETGGTLGQGALKKMTLNHRNSLLMLLKNYEFSTLCWVLPLRLALEGVTFLAAFLMGQPKRAVAVIGGLAGAVTGLKDALKERRRTARTRRVSDTCIMHRMYRGSVALAYYLGGIRRASDLPSRRMMSPWQDNFSCV